MILDSLGLPPLKRAKLLKLTKECLQVVKKEKGVLHGVFRHKK